MKKLFLPTTLCLLAMQAVQTMQAQEPRPDWAGGSTHHPPVPLGANFIYADGMGIGTNVQEAADKAWVVAFKDAAHKNAHIAIPQQKLDGINTKRDLEAYIATTVYSIDRVCQTPPMDMSDGKVKVYILLKVDKTGQHDARNANVVCESTAFVQAAKDWNEQMKDKEGGYSKSRAVALSFVPGAAQIYKGSTGKGVAFILGEAALVVGIVATEGLRASYKAKINPALDLNEAERFANKATNMKRGRNILIGCAAGLYVWNIIDGCVTDGKPRGSRYSKSNLQILPYATSQSGGVVVSLNF